MLSGHTNYKTADGSWSQSSVWLRSTRVCNINTYLTV